MAASEREEVHEGSPGDQTSSGRSSAATPRQAAERSGAGGLPHERDETVRFQIIWAAAQRGMDGIAELRKRQVKVRDDCLLCGRQLHDPPRGD